MEETKDNQVKNDEKIVFNGEILSKTLFEEKKQSLGKGVTLVEVSPGVYKTRLHD